MSTSSSEQHDLFQHALDKSPPVLWEQYKQGEIWCGDSLAKLSNINAESVDLCFTSPPFPLLRKKKYGNKDEDEYLDWLMPFIERITTTLKETGSLVIDLGCCWNKGQPTRSTYDLKLPLRLIEELGLHFAQEFYWYNPSRLPAPAEWVTIRRERVKDSVNKILWFGKSPHPKANNSRVLQPYSKAMEQRFGRVDERMRPSGHKPSDSLTNVRNDGAIPSNLIALSNSNSADPYLKYCKLNELKPHPARFPYQIPEFFIRFLTDADDLVLDPFAGSCTTGFAAEKNNRQWICIERDPTYVNTAPGHFCTRPEPRSSDLIAVPKPGMYASSENN